MNDKVKLAIGTIVAMLVLAILAVWSFSSGTDQSASLEISVAIVLVFGAGFILYMKGKAVKRKLPMEDEMSKKVAYRAGHYAFFAAMFSALAIGFFEQGLAKLLGQEVLSASQGTGLVVLVSGIVFMVAMIFFNYKGVSE